MQLVQFTFKRDASEAPRVFDTVKRYAGKATIGLENVTAKGKRHWRIAPRAPQYALDKIVGGFRPPLAPHLRTVWAQDRDAWRTVDLKTVRAVWCSRFGVGVRYVFE